MYINYGWDEGLKTTFELHQQKQTNVQMFAHGFINVANIEVSVAENFEERNKLASNAR